MKFNGVVIRAMGRELVMGSLRKDVCKIFHHLGMSDSVAWVVCVIWVEMVVLLIDSPFSQASHLCSLFEIF